MCFVLLVPFEFQSSEQYVHRRTVSNANLHLSLSLIVSANFRDPFTFAQTFGHTVASPSLTIQISHSHTAMTRNTLYEYCARCSKIMILYEVPSQPDHFVCHRICVRGVKLLAGVHLEGVLENFIHLCTKVYNFKKSLHDKLYWFLFS